MFIENTREKTRSFLENHGRKLDLARFDYLFGDETGRHVLKELEYYQCEDGGFGKGLAPDMVYQGSSAYSTSVALQIFDEIRADYQAMAFKAFNYLQDTYSPEYKGWKAMPESEQGKELAPWWDGTIPMTWATPTVRIIGYFHKYRINFAPLEELTEYAISFINKAKSEDLSIADVFAYISFYENVPKNIRTRIKDSLIRVTLGQIGKDINEWEEYGNMPALYVSSRDSLMYPYLEDKIIESLEYLLETSTNDGVWYPDWMWADEDDEQQQKSRDAWSGHLTVVYTALLREFNFL